MNETSSGIQVRKWISRLSTVHSIMKRDKGPAFINPTSGNQSTTSEMNDLFLELLTEIYDDHRELFPIDLRTTGDLSNKYHVYRSFRRGSESRAVSKEVAESRGSLSGQPMAEERESDKLKNVVAY